MKNKSRILVTGGCGFIGSNFIFSILSLQPSIEIINLDKLTYASNQSCQELLKNNKNYFFIKGDIIDRSLIKEILFKFKPNTIVNFAAETHVDRSISNPFQFIESNIVGTHNLIYESLNYYSELTNACKNSFKFIHISTDEVYGSLNKKEPPFTEESSYKPNNPYAASKASSDHLVRSFVETYGLPAITSNCSNNYGPFQLPEKLIPLCLLNAINKKSIPIYGDGLQIRDWLYVNDHCTAIYKLIENGKVGSTYNIGGWNEKTNLEVVTSLCQILDDIKPNSNGKSYLEQITFIKDRPGHDRRYAIDASKIEHELNWRPEETFETGLRKTVIWYLENQNWVAKIMSSEYVQWIEKQCT